MRKQVWSLPFLIGAAVVGSEPFTTAGDKSAPQRPPVNYHTPARQYEKTSEAGWTVMVEKQLMSEAPDVAAKALARLKEKLPQALAALPDSSHALLKQIAFFLMYGPKAANRGRDSGLEYFQKSASLKRDDIDPQWGNNVVIYCAENYTEISDLWALKVLVHEMAHAYQLQQWPETQVDIYQAWRNAMRRGLYHNVKDEYGRNLENAYAATNQLEYFAELSCMYFVRCDYHPFNRQELKEYDPVGYDMIEKMWRLQPGAPSDPDAERQGARPEIPPRPSPTAPGGLQHGRRLLTGRFAARLAAQHAGQFLQAFGLRQRLDLRHGAAAAARFADGPVPTSIAGRLR
jgi:hypothetical protein